MGLTAFNRRRREAARAAASADEPDTTDQPLPDELLTAYPVLTEKGLTTLNAIRAVKDETLVRLKGVGKTGLQAIREAQATLEG